VRTLISTGLSSKSVLRLATVQAFDVSGALLQGACDARWASFPSFTVVALMSLPIFEAMLANSLRLLVGAVRWRRGAALRERIDWTQARNSFVRSWTGIL